MKRANFLIVGLLVLSGCASTQPEKVPEFEAEAFPAVQMKGFKPRTIQLKVENTRTANRKVNNSGQVEQLVSIAVLDAFGRGGFTSSPKSPNRFVIQLMDCVDAAEGSACVKTKGRFESKAWVITLESQSSNGYTKGNSAYQSFGDMTSAYQSGIGMILNGLEEKYVEMTK